MKILTTAEQLDKITGWLTTGKPFYHTRYNDGEMLSIFRRREPKDSTSGEHHYTPEISAALHATLSYLLQWVNCNRSANVIFGSCCLDKILNPELRHMSARLLEIISKAGVVDALTFGPGDLWYHSDLEVANKPEGARLMSLLEAVKTRSVVLVGNSIIAKAAEFFSARYIEIPRADAYSEFDRVLKRCLQEATDKSVFLWCAGFPGKVWSWKTWLANQSTSHIDFGHLFDPVYGNGSRVWCNRDGPHTRFVREKLIPYMRR